MRVLIADNRVKVRSALQLLFEQEPDVEVVGEAASGGELLLLAAEKQPDLIVLDWDLPGNSVSAILHTVREMLPIVEIIVLSVRPEVGRVAQKAGVEVFVSKNAPAEDLLAAVDRCRQRSCSLNLPSEGHVMEPDGE